MKKDLPSEELIPGIGEPSPEPAPQKVETPRIRDLLKLFKHRNYRLMFAGLAVSLFGTWTQSIAQGWLVFSLTHSPLYLGLVTFCLSSPAFFLSTFGGTIADRSDKRKMLMRTQTLLMLQSGTMAALTLSGHITVHMIMALVLFQGIVNAFDMPTRQSLTIELVGREDLKRAIALNSMLFHTSRLIGPPLGGLLVATVGEGWCFAINTVSFAGILSGLALMNLPPRILKKAGSPLRELKAGIVYALHHKNIRQALIVVAVSAAMGGTYLSMMPAVARQLLHLGSGGMGLLMSCVGVGALCGAFVLARVGNRNLVQYHMGACVALGASLICFAQSRWLPLSMFLLIPTSFSLMFGGGCAQTVIQSHTEDHMRGRVMALYITCFMGMMPWGSLVIGTLGSHLGIANALTIGGSCCFLTGAFMYLRRFGLPKFGRA